MSCHSPRLETSLSLLLPPTVSSVNSYPFTYSYHGVCKSTTHSSKHYPIVCRGVLHSLSVSRYLFTLGKWLGLIGCGRLDPGDYANGSLSLSPFPLSLTSHNPTSYKDSARIVVYHLFRPFVLHLLRPAMVVSIQSTT